MKSKNYTVMISLVVHNSNKAAVAAPRAQLLKGSARLLHLLGDKAPPATHDSSEVVRV